MNISTREGVKYLQCTAVLIECGRALERCSAWYEFICGGWDASCCQFLKDGHLWTPYIGIVLKQMFTYLETLQDDFIPLPQQIILGVTDRTSFISFTELNIEIFILGMLAFKSGLIDQTLLITYVICWCTGQTFMSVSLFLKQQEQKEVNVIPKPCSL